MPEITRTYHTDLADLAYQLSRSGEVGDIRRELAAMLLDDQEAQARLLDLAQRGRCQVDGDYGMEEFRWTLSEVEIGRLTSILYREYLQAA